MFNIIKKWTTIPRRVEVQAMKARIRILEIENAALRKKVGLLFQPTVTDVVPVEVLDHLIQGPLVLDERPLAVVVSEKSQETAWKCDDSSCFRCRG